MNKKLKSIVLGLFMVLVLASCSSNAQESKTIVRVGHNQSQNHPTHLRLLEFEKYVEDRLGDKYDIQVYPSELLGSQTDKIGRASCRARMERSKDVTADSKSDR